MPAAASDLPCATSSAERRSAPPALGESAWIQVHVTVDHLERVAAGSRVASRALSAVRPRDLAGSGTAAAHPTIEGPFLDWVLERLSEGSEPGRDLPRVACSTPSAVTVASSRCSRPGASTHTEPTRVWSVRTRGDGKIVAAGALEYLSATPSEIFDAVLLTSVVDRLRPGAARALAQLAARSLAPGGVVVLVSARPEAAVAMDPVAADLAPGRPLHPVTWCHLLAHSGLAELAVFEPDTRADPDRAQSPRFSPFPRGGCPRASQPPSEHAYEGTAGPDRPGHSLHRRA